MTLKELERTERDMELSDGKALAYGRRRSGFYHGMPRYASDPNSERIGPVELEEYLAGVTRLVTRDYDDSDW